MHFDRSRGAIFINQANVDVKTICANIELLRYNPATTSMVNGTPTYLFTSSAHKMSATDVNNILGTSEVNEMLGPRSISASSSSSLTNNVFTAFYNISEDVQCIDDAGRITRGREGSLMVSRAVSQFLIMHYIPK